MNTPVTKEKLKFDVNGAVNESERINQPRSAPACHGYCE